MPNFKTDARLLLISGIFMLLVTFSVSGFDKTASLSETEVSQLYESIAYDLQERPAYEIFRRALLGYHELEHTQRLLSGKGIITIIDFRKSANLKRLWVIDLNKRKLLFHTYTAHGRNSGDLFAERFSNTANSNQSSLGFYVTGKTYIGKHGTSLKLHGVEKGINDKAEERAIVMHGADYVSESFIKKVGRLGRSFGCPAIPMELHKEIISTVADGTCLFIYYPDAVYIATTKFKDVAEQLVDSRF